MVGTPRIELDSMAFQTTAKTTLAQYPNMVEDKGIEPFAAFLQGKSAPQCIPRKTKPSVLPLDDLTFAPP